jgi:hypothetical protein
MTKLSDKQALSEQPSKFDLKFLLVGDSGSGKTHLCGTYTRGPLHFYMLDPGGEKTLYKLNKNRAADNQITMDLLPERQTTWATFWRTIQRDEKDGLFDELAEKNGLVVLPDSLSAASDMVLRDVASQNNRTLDSQSAPLRIQDWGQATQWIKTLISVFNDLPCAAVMTAHLYVEKDQSTGDVIARYPMVTGAMRTTIGRFFDEVYLLAPMGKSYQVYFKEFKQFNSKSRHFEARSVKNITMDTLAEAYMTGKQLSEAKEEPTKGGETEKKPTPGVALPR